MTTTWNRMVSGASAEAGEEPGLDEAQLQEALDQYWSRVCRTLYQLVGSWDEAEDLALEVFYRLHQRPPADLTVVGSWLYRVATHVGLNALRARKRRAKYEGVAGRYHLERRSAVDPATELERKETQSRVRAVLANMRLRSARLLFLRYLGLSYAELAEALDLAPGSVGKLLSRARKEFERRYRALEENDEARD